MTEKRFEAKTIRADKRADWVVGVFDNGVLINNFGVVHILNELSEENERLKEEIKSLTSNLEEDYIIFKRDKNPPNPKFCSECWNYETEYEEVIAFGDYETLTKISCSKGHSIFDDNDAMDCPDYDPKD